jgi:hypothetical protein
VLVTDLTPQPAAEGTVIYLNAKDVVILVLGAVTLTVTFVGLVVKLIELGRK